VKISPNLLTISKKVFYVQIFNMQINDLNLFLIDIVVLKIFQMAFNNKDSQFQILLARKGISKILKTCVVNTFSFYCTLVNVFYTSLWKFENGTKIKSFCRGSIYDFWMIYLLFMLVTIDNPNHKSHSLKFHVIWISSWH